MPEPLLRSFATTEEFISHLQNEEREAAAAMLPWQRNLVPGDRIAYAYRYEGGEEITIYFELLTPDGPKLKASRMWGKVFDPLPGRRARIDVALQCAGQSHFRSVGSGALPQLAGD